MTSPIKRRRLDPSPQPDPAAEPSSAPSRLVLPRLHDLGPAPASPGDALPGPRQMFPGAFARPPVEPRPPLQAMFGVLIPEEPHTRPHQPFMPAAPSDALDPPFAARQAVPSLAWAAAAGTEADVPPRFKTPRGVHLSEAGKAEVVRLRSLVPPATYAAIGKALGVTQATARNVAIAWLGKPRSVTPPTPTEDAPQRSKTPGGVHLTEAGRAEILRLRAQVPPLSLEKVARKFKVSRGTVNAVMAQQEKAVRDGVKSPGGMHITDFGRREVARLARPPFRFRPANIAAELALTSETVMSVLDAGDSEPLAGIRTGPGTVSDDGKAEVPARASRPDAPDRPVVQVQDWREVQSRDWNAGDRFSMMLDNLPAFFEIARDRHAGDDIARRDFIPLIRGG